MSGAELTLPTDDSKSEHDTSSPTKRNQSLAKSKGGNSPTSKNTGGGGGGGGGSRSPNSNVGKSSAAHKLGSSQSSNNTSSNNHSKDKLPSRGNSQQHIASGRCSSKVMARYIICSLLLELVQDRTY